MTKIKTKTKINLLCKSNLQVCRLNLVLDLDLLYLKFPNNTTILKTGYSYTSPY